MKKLLGLILALCMVVSLAACGGGKPYATVEDYVNSSEVQEQITSTDLTGSGIGSLDIVAEGSKMVFVYTLETQVDAAATAEALEASLDAQASTFTEAVKEMQGQVEEENPSIVLRYLNAAGTEIISKEYTAS